MILLRCRAWLPEGVAVLRGALLAESLRLGHELRVDGLTLRGVVRRDVSDGTTPAQPGIWTFLEFAAPDDAAEALADALAAALLDKGGWYADFRAGADHVVVFAGRTFRYRRGDTTARAKAEQYGRGVGVPDHQLDWSE